MNDLRNKIFDIIKDYHSDEESSLKKDDIITWVKQFDESDQSFVLEEFLHILSQGTYISKAKAKELLWENFTRVLLMLGYRARVKEFIYESHFFNDQKVGKSQTELFRLLDEIVKGEVGVALNTSDGREVKNFIYIDDIIATGGTVLNKIKKWVGEGDNLKNINVGKYKLILSVFCMHTWGFDNLKISLKLNFNSDVFTKLPIQVNYVIDNRVIYPSAKLNLAYPIATQSDVVKKYFEELKPKFEKYSDRAYRSVDKPLNEMLFSSAANRTRFENIILYY